MWKGRRSGGRETTGEKTKQRSDSRKGGAEGDVRGEQGGKKAREGQTEANAFKSEVAAEGSSGSRTFRTAVVDERQA